MEKSLKVSLKRVQILKKLTHTLFPVEYFKKWKTVGHISGEISRHVCYFIKTESGFVNSTVISTKFRPSSISVGRLEISIFLKFLCYKQATFQKMKMFLQILSDYNFVGTVTKDNSDEENEMTIGMLTTNS